MDDKVIIGTERLILRQYRLDDVNDVAEGVDIKWKPKKIF